MFTEKFESLAKAINLQPAERSIAEFFWYSGLRHAFQRGTSQPALLQTNGSACGATIPPKEEFKWNFPSKPAYPNPRAPSYVNKYPEKNIGLEDELTPYEAKLISILLTEVLTHSQVGVKNLEANINYMWKYCDKDNENTEPVFKEMNRVKSRLHRLKGQVKTLADSQRKLKKISKGL